MKRGAVASGIALGLASWLLLTKSKVEKGPADGETTMKPDERVQALIAFLGDRARVIQTTRTLEAQKKAIASGASEWSSPPEDAPHVKGLAVDMQPAEDVPGWLDEEGWIAWAEEVKAAAEQLGLNPRWGGHWKPIQDADVRGGIASYRDWKAKEGEKPFWDPVHWDFSGTSKGIYLSPYGYRRALEIEVSAAMRADAVRSLKAPIGSFLVRDGYAIGIETHEDAARGPHKGASVFLPSALDIDSPANA